MLIYVVLIILVVILKSR